jgi:hypothetical protein
VFVVELLLLYEIVHQECRFKPIFSLSLTPNSILNKLHTQPRECLRAAETNTVSRLDQCFKDLKCQNILGLGDAKSAENVLGPRRGGLPV